MATDDVAGREDLRALRGVGRRKQFKPVRVCLSDAVNREDEARTNGSRENNFSASDEKSVNSNDFIDDDQMPSESCQPIVCPDCGAELQSPALFDQHFKSLHNSQSSEGTSFPTPYHRLARELQKCTASTQLEKNASKIDVDKLPSEAESLIKSSSERESLKASDVNGTALVQLLNIRPKESTEYKINQDVEKPSDPPECGQSFLDRVVEEEMAKGSPAYEGLKKSPKPSTPNAQQSLPASSDLYCKFSNPVEAEDFCNLCKKHFCNKYYLRKHKQDVHGISSETSHQGAAMNNDYLGFPTSDLKQSSSNLCQATQTANDKIKSTDSQRFTDSLSSIVSGLPFGLPFTSDMPSSFLFPQGVASSSQSGIFNSASTISNLASIMLLNPFISPLSLLKNAPMLQQTQAANSTSSSLNTLSELQNFGLSSALLSDSSPKNSLMYRFPPQETSASCDLCQKEFCSTYFLKVHKRDKHGIPLEEMTGQMPVKKQLNSKLTPAPMYSIDGIEPGENITPLSKFRGEDKGLYPFGNKKHEETCFLCKQQFSSRYSLMMHLLTSHNIKPEGFGLASELMQMEMLTNNQIPFTRSSTGSKTSERVACNICNKEVCNKYFLKTHKLKVHGIQEGQTDPPISVHEASKGPSLSSSSSNPPDPWNLNLDQLMQKYDEIAKQFNVSLPNEFSKKSIDLKLESRKDPELPGKPFPRSFNPLDPSPFLKVSEKSESFPNMFGTLDLIAKNKIFDYKSADFQGIANHFGLLDFPQSFKVMGSSSGKSKPTNILKHLSGKEGKPSDDGSSKLGYDPEAYCEICKKEFCSKYFLKTHKQKIHGLRCDGTSDSKSPSLTQAPQNANPSAPFSSDFAFDGPLGRGKEPLPSNMTRVTCEICGKELCNKYFLRTHMLKIHGIADVSTMKGPQIDSNKQEINSFSRKDSPPAETPTGEQFFQKNKFSQPKPTELIQPQNLVIGVKELKQVTEMLLQSTDNSSSFDQTSDDPLGQAGPHDPRGVLTSKDPKNESTSRLENDFDKSDYRETKLSSTLFPSILPESNDIHWRDEFSKFQNFMNHNSCNNRRQQDQLEQIRKRKLIHDDNDMKNVKKFAPNFMEKENEKSTLRSADRFNSLQPTQTSGGDFTRTSGLNDAGLPVVDKCILQPFELQEASNENAFAQCKVFLPVVQPICEPITLKFTVTPVDH